MISMWWRCEGIINPACSKGLDVLAYTHLHAFVLWHFQLLFHCNYHKLMQKLLYMGASKQVHIHTHMRNAVSLVWGSPQWEVTACWAGAKVSWKQAHPQEWAHLPFFWMKLLCSKVCTYSCCNTAVMCIEEALLWSCRTNNCYHYTSKYLTIESLQNHCMRTSTSQLVHHCGANLGCWINLCHGT